MTCVNAELSALLSLVQMHVCIHIKYCSAGADHDMVIALQDSILVAGYPLGGDSLSITKGIVSRVSLMMTQ